VSEVRILPIGATARTIWRDTPRLFRVHLLLWVICLTLYVAVTFLDLRWADKPNLTRGVGPIWQGLLGEIVTYLLPALLLIPAALATHRSVILGVVERPTAILSDRPRVWRYAVLEIMAFGLAVILVSVASKAMRIADAPDVSDGTASIMVTIGICILILIVALLLRMAACFPAAAVGSGWQDVTAAWRALRGQILRVTALALITPAGVFAVVWITVLITVGGSAEVEAAADRSLGAHAIESALLGCVTYCWVITMSHIYKAVITAPPEAAIPR
jgi:hypothetical protein